MKHSHGYVGISFDIGKPNRLIFCESVIAYQTLRLAAEEQGKLSFLDTVNSSRLSHYLKAIKDTTTYFQTHAGLITLAVDNDQVGRDFHQKLLDKGLSIQSDLPPLLENKDTTDWNDIVKQNQEPSLSEAIESAQIQILRTNPPPKQSRMIEL